MRFYFRYKMILDHIISISVASILVIINKYSSILSGVDQEKYFQFLMMISASGISLLGFVLAASGLLISHVQNERMSIFRNSTGFKQLLMIMKSALWRLLYLSILSILCIFINENEGVLIAMSLLYLGNLVILSIASLIWSTMAILSIPVD